MYLILPELTFVWVSWDSNPTQAGDVSRKPPLFYSSCSSSATVRSRTHPAAFATAFHF